MTGARSWTLSVIFVVMLVVGSVVALNIVVDANGVLWNDPSHWFQTPNISFTKMNFLLRHPKEFGSFLFGSSRENGIHVRDVPSPSFYNLFLPAGLPQEFFAHLECLLKNGVVVRNVMIGLDEFSPLFDPAENASELDLQSHPAVSGQSWITFYAQHFLKLNRIIPQVKAYLRFAYPSDGTSRVSNFNYDLIGSGNVYCTECDEEIERDVQAHDRDPKFLHPWEYRFAEGDHFVQSLEAIRRIVALSHTRGFRLIIFINPLHRTTYLNTDLRRFAKFKRDLASITDYYDFSGLNSVTTNNYYYYETSHFRPVVGDMMLRVMLGAPSVAVPRDFGFLVTSSNVESHLLRQCQEVRRSSGPPVRGRESLAGSC